MSTDDPPPKPTDEDEPASMDVDEFAALLGGALRAGRPGGEPEAQGEGSADADK